jgi:hypothetical protein
MSEGQFSLRSLFAGIAIIAAALGLLLWLARAAGEADRQAIRSAYRDGRLTRERAVELLGDDTKLESRPWLYNPGAGHDADY